MLLNSPEVRIGEILDEFNALQYSPTYYYIFNCGKFSAENAGNGSSKTLNFLRVHAPSPPQKNAPLVFEIITKQPVCVPLKKSLFTQCYAQKNHYCRRKARENMQPVPNARKHSIGAKHGNLLGTVFCLEFDLINSQDVT